MVLQWLRIHFTLQAMPSQTLAWGTKIPHA